MKQFKFLAVALAVLMFASCSKDKGVNNPSPEGEPAVLNLSFAGGTKSKAVGPAKDATDQTIGTFVVYVFDKEGTILNSTFPRDLVWSSNTGISIDITTVAHSVYIVANGGNKTGTLLTGINDEATLKTHTIDRETNASIFSAGAVVMSGATTGLKFETTGTTVSTNVDVVLTFPVSKIVVAIDDKRSGNATAGTAGITGETTAVTTITDNNVSLLYSGKTFPLFSSTINGGLAQNTHTAFYSSTITYPSYSGTTTATVPVTTPEIVTDAVTGAAVPNVGWTGGVGVGVDFVGDYHFYVAANDAATQPTILMIQSTKVIASASTANAFLNGTYEIYYPVKFDNVNGNDFRLELGHSYHVNITITGAVDDGLAVGDPSPEVKVPIANMNVTITPATWETVTREVAFD